MLPDNKYADFQRKKSINDKLLKEKLQREEKKVKEEQEKVEKADKAERGSQKSIQTQSSAQMLERMGTVQVADLPSDDKKVKMLKTLVDKKKPRNEATEQDYLNSLAYTELNINTIKVVKDSTKLMSRKLNTQVDDEIKNALMIQHEDNVRKHLTYQQQKQDRTLNKPKKIMYEHQQGIQAAGVKLKVGLNCHLNSEL